MLWHRESLKGISVSLQRDCRECRYTRTVWSLLNNVFFFFFFYQKLLQESRISSIYQLFLWWFRSRITEEEEGMSQGFHSPLSLHDYYNLWTLCGQGQFYFIFVINIFFSLNQNLAQYLVLNICWISESISPCTDSTPPQNGYKALTFIWLGLPGWLRW